MLLSAKSVKAWVGVVQMAFVLEAKLMFSSKGAGD